MLRWSNCFSGVIALVEYLLQSTRKCLSNITNKRDRLLGRKLPWDTSRFVGATTITLYRENDYLHRATALIEQPSCTSDL